MKLCKPAFSSVLNCFAIVLVDSHLIPPSITLFQKMVQVLIRSQRFAVYEYYSYVVEHKGLYVQELELLHLTLVRAIAYMYG